MHRNIFIIIVLMCISPACVAGESGATLAAEASAAPSPANPPAADGIVFQALAVLGVGYKRGGKLPSGGFDCSGLVRYVFHEARGVDLPYTARDLARVGEKIGRDAL